MASPSSTTAADHIKYLTINQPLHTDEDCVTTGDAAAMATARRANLLIYLIASTTEEEQRIHSLAYIYTPWPSHNKHHG